MGKHPVTIAKRDNDVILTRVFAAPRKLVFETWTNPVHIARWFGPHFLTQSSATSERKTGGAVSITMHGPAGEDYPMSGTITDYVEGERVTYRLDLKEHPADFHDMIRTTFEELRDGRAGSPTNLASMIASFADHPEGTLLTLTMRFDTPIERDVHFKVGMNEGWSESFEKLDSLLADLQQG